MPNSLHVLLQMKSKKIVRKLIAVILSCSLFGCLRATSILELPAPTEKDPVNAVWFSYLDYQETAYNSAEYVFRNTVDEIIAELQELGVNTIYVHAVAFTDAFYKSDIYPQTQLIGTMEYDPLAIFVEEAKKSDMRVEAWVNPLRSVLVSEADLLEGTILKQWIDENNERIRQVDGRYYLNPAYPEVRQLVCSVVEEILDNYDVDGIQFDDYFYPANTEDRFDAYIFGEENYLTGISREDFRRNAIDQLVADVHDTVKAKSPYLSFGISVAGNLENDLNIYFADPQAWIDAGTIDYLIPQIYWGFEHPTKPYAETLQEWMAMTENSDTALYAGLAAYKIGTEDIYAGDASAEWIDNTDILARQIEYAYASGCKGIALFRYGSLYFPENDKEENVGKEIINIKNSLSHFED